MTARKDPNTGVRNYTSHPVTVSQRIALDDGDLSVVLYGMAFGADDTTAVLDALGAKDRTVVTASIRDRFTAAVLAVASEGSELYGAHTAADPVGARKRMAAVQALIARTYGVPTTE